MFVQLKINILLFKKKTTTGAYYELSQRQSRRASKSSLYSEQSLFKRSTQQFQQETSHTTTTKRRSSSTENSLRYSPSPESLTKYKLKSRSAHSDFIRGGEHEIIPITLQTSDFAHSSSAIQSRGGEVNIQFQLPQPQQSYATGYQSYSSMNENANMSMHRQYHYSTSGNASARHLYYDQQPSIDYSTTLIKDINPHYEPVELILKGNKNINNSCTYIKEIGSASSSQTRFEQPLHTKYIVHKNINRSESLPPNSRMVARSAYEYSSIYGETEDDEFYYYTDKQDKENKEATLYKEPPQKKFEPIELVLDSAEFQSEQMTSKRVRDLSLPAKPKRAKKPGYESDYDSEADRMKSKISSFQFEAQHSEKRVAHGKDIIHFAPVVEKHLLESITVDEGEDVTFECIIKGKQKNKKRKFLKINFFYL